MLNIFKIQYQSFQNYYLAIDAFRYVYITVDYIKYFTAKKVELYLD